MSDTHNGKPVSVWMRSIKDHTYHGKAQPVGSIYLAHEEIIDYIENIENLKFAVREAVPPTAVRQPKATPPLVAEAVPVPPAPVTVQDQAEPVSTAGADSSEDHAAAAAVAKPVTRTGRR